MYGYEQLTIHSCNIHQFDLVSLNANNHSVHPDSIQGSEDYVYITYSIVIGSIGYTVLQKYLQFCTLFVFVPSMFVSMLSIVYVHSSELTSETHYLCIASHVCLSVVATQHLSYSTLCTRNIVWYQYWSR